MISNQRILYALESDEPSSTGERKSSEVEVKTECFEFGSVVTQAWDEEHNKNYNQEYLNSSDNEDNGPPRKRRRSHKKYAIPNAEPDSELTLQQMILDLRQQNERILRQLTPIQSTLQKTCHNTSLLLLQQLKQNQSEVESTITSYMPPPPIGNVDDFDSFESFLAQNSHAPSKDSTSSVNELVSNNISNELSR